jgi:hypothetical protein
MDYAIVVDIENFIANFFRRSDPVLDLDPERLFRIRPGRKVWIQPEPDTQPWLKLAK